MESCCPRRLKFRWARTEDHAGQGRKICNCNLALIESLGKTNIKSYKSEDDVDKHMPTKGFGAGM